MNRKLKQATTRASRTSKSLFKGSSSSSNRREAILSYARGEEEHRPIAFQISDDKEEERHGEEAKNVGEGPNEEEEAELERVSRQTRTSRLCPHEKRIEF
jgi:hypothetical protein